MQDKIGVPILGFAAFSREVAAEGAVLLKNEQQVLPLKKGEKVAIFGRIQYDYYRSGTGSGGSVNVSYTTNLTDSLKETQMLMIDETVDHLYMDWLKAHPFDNGGGGWAAEPWFQQEMPVDKEVIDLASKRNDKAIVVIGRTAGEDQDNLAERGSYYLTEREEGLIKQVSESFRHVIVVLNTSNIIDTSWMMRFKVSGLLYSWHGGMEGGRACSDVLVGKVTPSGKLPDTIAHRLEDYPSNANYGGKAENIYQEDIYVGYRYFETFNKQAVQYPFGYGLSYTTFEWRNELLRYDTNEDRLSFSVTVTNTGSYPGKETVQAYVSLPQGQLGQPARELIGFKKTELLEVGAETTVSFDVSLAALATYDDSGVTGYKSSYVLEAGRYLFYLGRSVREQYELEVEGEPFTLKSTRLVAEQEEALAPVKAFKRIKPGERQGNGEYRITYEDVPTRMVDLQSRITARMPAEIQKVENQCYTLKQVAAGEVSLATFIGQLTDEELAILVRGEGMVSPLVTPGTASAFGGLSDRLVSLGIPVASCADGPSGIRMDSGHKATQVPIGTLLASTFNPELIEALYRFEGKELRQNEIDMLLGPGINIHRHPLNGRNFEYFSEDPLLTGVMAVSNIKGIMASGAHATVKHFACNSQEASRNKVDAVVSERALRQIYLKGFEMAVKDGQVKGIMTAYNPINGHWSASNYDLNTTILRKEWGYRGIVMTDWWAVMNDPVFGGPAAASYTDHMLRAQNDLYMVVNNYGAETNQSNDQTLKGLKTGTLTRAELQRSVQNILSFLMEAPVFNRKQVFRDHVGFIPETSAIEQEVTPLPEHGRVVIQSHASVTIEIKKTATYRLYAEYVSQGEDLSQVATAILLNDVNVATVQANGSTDASIEQKLPKVSLAKGYYQMTFADVKPGVSITAVTFQAL